ncbi:MAG: glycosyltransferase, partial [Riemerella sp.]|nr:glycosyltransferase [Riemerella sp.]
MKRIAVVILNWNGKSWLEKFLPTVLKYSESAQIYVVDNASTDDSVSFLENDFPSVKVIQNTENSGFAGGYNEGLKKVEEEIYCLLNSDVEVTEGWLEPVLDLFEQNPEIAAIQPKILSYYRKNYFEFAGAGGGLIDNLGYPYCRGRVFDDLEEDKGQYD